jgi:hypothetical protein
MGLYKLYMYWICFLFEAVEISLIIFICRPIRGEAGPFSWALGQWGGGNLQNLKIVISKRKCVLLLLAF